MAKIIDGKACAAKLKQKIKLAVKKRTQQKLATPGLAVVIVGNDQASEIYVRNKRKSCQEVGINSFHHKLAANVNEQELLGLIEKLNQNENVHGILVQLPLPAHIDTRKVIETIMPSKDVDGFHPYNLGRLAQKHPLLRPCTPKGIMTLLQQTLGDLTGKHAVVIGASNIVGRPMALELLLANCTTTVCHSKTQDLPSIARQADILISAVGKPEFVKASWIKPGATVIDVGINRRADGKLHGDVDFSAVSEIAAWITPVPGGVGPMTVASLLENTLLAAQ